MRGGGKGGRERTWAATLHQGKKLAKPRRGQPDRVAGVRTPGPRRDGLGGAWRAGRGLATPKPVGGAWRHVREEGARCSGSPRTRSLGGWRACLPAHVCVIFEMECEAGGAAGAWGRPRRRRDGVRPALPQPPRALFARQPGWLVTRFPRSPEVPATHLDGEILALPKQLRRPRAPTEKRCLSRVLFRLLPSPEQSHSLRYTPVHPPGPRGGLCVVCALAPNIPSPSGCMARPIYE